MRVSPQHMFLDDSIRKSDFALDQAEICLNYGAGPMIRSRAARDSKLITY